MCNFFHYNIQDLLLVVGSFVFIVDGYEYKSGGGEGQQDLLKGTWVDVAPLCIHYTT